MTGKKNILVLGGGYAGFNSAVALTKKLNQNQKDEFQITLVDKNDYHLFQPNLYELATSEEEFTSIADLKHSIVVPFKKYLPKEVNFLRGQVEKINQTEKTVQIGERQLPFEYLVLAFGSAPDFFKIPGLQENSYTLKSLSDALRIRSEVESIVSEHQLDFQKRTLRFAIGGGGFSGVELAGELVKLLQIVSWKYNYPLERLEIVILEGTSQLLPGLPTEISAKVSERLSILPVRIFIHTQNLISAVSKNQITVSNGEVINFELLIWTGGVRAVAAPLVDSGAIDNRSRAIVNSQLVLQGTENIYALGDNAAILGKDKRPQPQTATQAIYQADYVSSAIAARINGVKIKDFVPKEFPYIIPVSGKWAVLHWPKGGSYYGFMPWLLKRLADLRYFMRLMPFWKALNLAWFDSGLYIEND